MRASRSDGKVHISGAEGLYNAEDIVAAAASYAARAMDHDRGEPGEVVITVERLSGRPKTVPLLQFETLSSRSARQAGEIILRLLNSAGVSDRAIAEGLGVVRGKAAMRGAALVRARSGIRAEPDPARGVRVSRLGLEKSSAARLSRRLARHGINTSTVKEALILASKAASCSGLLAELCVSDDPAYTTGYVASSRLGYVRIPSIKSRGSMSGGRVFFIDDDADVEAVRRYLEEQPVLVS